MPSKQRRVFQGMWFGAVAMVVAFWPEPAAAADAFADCVEDAAVAANNCYMNADGYWENKKCDWRWDASVLGCVVIYT